MSELSQLKSSALTFDSDDPASAWSTSSKAIEQWVGSLKHGAALIAFLDLVLERSITARDSALVPSFLLGGPWGSPNVLSGEVSNDDASSPLKTRGAASGHNVPVTPLTPIYRSQSYTELPHRGATAARPSAVALLAIDRAWLESCSFGASRPAFVHTRYGDASQAFRGR